MGMPGFFWLTFFTATASFAIPLIYTVGKHYREERRIRTEKGDKTYKLATPKGTGMTVFFAILGLISLVVTVVGLMREINAA